MAKIESPASAQLPVFPLNRHWLRAIYRDHATRLVALGNVTELALCSLNPLFRELHVTDRTDLVVEGYPRSGANFAANLIQAATPPNRPPLSISYRRHTRSQIVTAQTKQIPVIILLRSPRDTIKSYFVATEGKIPIGYLVRNYVAYYDFIKRKSAYVSLFSFDELSTNPQKFLDCATRVLGTSLLGAEAAERLAKDKAGEFYQQLAGHKKDELLAQREAATPTAWKEKKKAALGAALEEHKAELADANRIYSDLLSMIDS